MTNKISTETKEKFVKTALEIYKSKSKFFNENEFKKDVYALFIIKKMINKFIRTGIINDKLLINNIIISYNIFDNKIIDLFKIIMQTKEMEIIKSFLLFLDLYDQDDDINTNEIIDNLLNDVAHRFKIRYKYD